MTSCTRSFVLSFHELSVVNLSLITSRDFLIGVLVNKDTTSWEFKISSLSSVISARVCARCLEFLTRCSVLPTTHERMSARYLVNQVKSQMLTLKTKKTTRKRIRQLLSDEPKSIVVIPYVQDLSEAVSRVYKRHGIHTVMRPFQSIRNLLVHPKDRHRPQDICECVYKIPCKNCNKTYIGETGRAFGVRLQEHRQAVSQRDVRAYISGRSKTSR